MPVVCERPTINPLGEKVAEPCTTVAVFDVLYRLRTEQEPRGVRVCLTHFEELKELKRRGLLAEWDARAITR